VSKYEAQLGGREEVKKHSKEVCCFMSHASSP
jgi:hypothetical protein